MGAVVNGALLRGHQDVGAEFGHITMLLDGPSCPCGKRGCLEAITSDIGIMQAATTANPARYGGAPIGQLTAWALAGDEPLRQIFDHAGVMLGVGLSCLINLFAPELLVLTGEGLRAGDLLLEPLRRTLPRCTFRGRLELTEIVFKPWAPGWEPWARGAATLVLDDMLRLPLYEQPSEEQRTTPTADRHAK
jgi:predicted NBD/HSP70 family sugar kinase